MFTLLLFHVLSKIVLLNLRHMDYRGVEQRLLDSLTGIRGKNRGRDGAGCQSPTPSLLETLGLLTNLLLTVLVTVTIREEYGGPGGLLLTSAISLSQAATSGLFLR